MKSRLIFDTVASPAAHQSRRLRGLSPEPSPHPLIRRRIGGTLGDNLVEANASIDSPTTPSAGATLDHLVGHPPGEVRESHRDKEHPAFDSRLLDRVVIEDIRDTSDDPANPRLLIHVDPFWFISRIRYSIP